MSDRLLAERLQPSLLDRLTDDAPEAESERREDRVIDARRLREILQRDLAWLLNTNNHESLLDPARHRQVIASTVNYGIREVSGEVSTAKRAEGIRQSISDAIIRFEPRINPQTLRVEFREGNARGETVIEFDISADMWAQPMPLQLYMRSVVNVVTGELTLERSG